MGGSNKSMVTMAQPNWFVIGGLALLVSLVFFQPFLGVICLAGLMAYTFAPVYAVLNRKISSRFAAIVVLFATFAIVVVPIIVIVVVAVSQGVAFAEWLASLASGAGSTLNTTAHPVADTVNQSLAPLTHGQEVLTADSIKHFVKEVVPGLIKNIATAVINVAGSVSIVVTSTILYAYLFQMFLVNGAALRRTIHAVSPFSREESDMYLRRIGSTIKGGVRGQLTVAFVMAVASALVLLPLGLGKYFFFLVIMLTILGMVPLGGGILVVPVCIIAMLSGQFWPGFWALVVYLFGVCNIDNFLRPRLMPKDAKLIPAITVLATFCGIYYFGILGVVYGPLIAIVLVTTFEVYLHTRQLADIQGRKHQLTT